ncbi:MAG: Hpt domain-containing protein [Epsilonproteobacteria bacterium]|nr:Hpt domain-containing protein [Campylobacterota bacterium]
MPIHIPDYSNLNHETLAAQIGIKPKFIPMLIASFTDESVELLAKLSSSIASKDYPSLKSAAHSIKGSAGNLKLDELFEMAKAIEAAASAGDESFDYIEYRNAIEASIKTIS